MALARNSGTGLSSAAFYVETNTNCRTPAAFAAAIRWRLPSTSTFSIESLPVFETLAVVTTAATALQARARLSGSRKSPTTGRALFAVEQLTCSLRADERTDGLASLEQAAHDPAAERTAGSDDEDHAGLQTLGSSLRRPPVRSAFSFLQRRRS